MTYLGIDPGKNGGFAWGDGTPGRVQCAKVPSTTGGMVDLIRIISPDIARLEQVGGYIGFEQPGLAMFVFGQSFGELRGALAALRVNFSMITPQAWQKALALGNSKGMSKTEWKNKLKQKAIELYPATKITLATSDAVLIYHALVLASQPHKLKHEEELGF